MFETMLWPVFNQIVELFLTSNFRPNAHLDRLGNFLGMHGNFLGMSRNFLGMEMVTAVRSGCGLSTILSE